MGDCLLRYAKKQFHARASKILLSEVQSHSPERPKRVNVNNGDEGSPHTVAPV